MASPRLITGTLFQCSRLSNTAKFRLSTPFKTFTTSSIVSTTKDSTNPTKNGLHHASAGQKFGPTPIKIQQFETKKLTSKFFTTTSVSASTSTTTNTSTDSTYSDKSQHNNNNNDQSNQFSKPIVSKHLYTIAGLCFAIVVVGGLTRLTESGLSITEWNLVTGSLPPLTHDQWVAELEKYQVTPEGRMLNKGIELEDFKKIYFMEYGHRLLGRFIGLAFLLPIPIFMVRKKIAPRTTAAMLGIGALIGGQGFLGWYMVQSGLSEELVAASHGGVPRVSQYRLAAHLGLAFIVYFACLRLGWGVARDWKVFQAIKNSTNVKLSGLNASPKQVLDTLVSNPTVGRTRIAVNLLMGLAFLTALSGAFVAGLDAGLLYNTFPHMGHDSETEAPVFVPPRHEILNPVYTREAGSRPREEDKDAPITPTLIWYNMLENPTTVQFDHRVLAISTFFSTMGLFLYSTRPSIKAVLPPSTYKLIHSMFGMAAIQAGLGISTLIYLVPIPLASAHQTGSLILLTLCLAASASLRRPHRLLRNMINKRF